MLLSSSWSGQVLGRKWDEGELGSGEELGAGVGLELGVELGVELDVGLVLALPVADHLQ